jgi:DNA-binding NarL/FixJ family response regulator
MRVTTATAGDGDNLSRREREVARLIAQGLSDREVATTLAISSNTAKAHISNILRKLDLNDRSQIVDWHGNGPDW